MSAPLTIVIRGFKKAPDGIAVYWHWGAKTKATIKKAVTDTRKALEGVSCESDIPTILRALLAHLNKGAGLMTSVTWYLRPWLEDPEAIEEDMRLYYSEIQIIARMLGEKGMRIYTDSDCGAIAFTPGLVDRLHRRCDRSEEIDITEDLCG